MDSKAKGCWPAIVVAGFLALGSAQVQACDTATCGRIVVAENTDQTAAAGTDSAALKAGRHGRHHAHHATRSRSEKHAAKSAASDQKKASGGDRKDAAGSGEGAALSPTVANANAQMAAEAGPPVSPGSAPSDASDQAPKPAQNGAAVQSSAAEPSPPISEAWVVEADELNDLDRAALPDKPAGKILHPAPASPHVASQLSEDTWNQASMVGKIFIVMGGFLTLASAARMFIA
jgi:hypothetical protein